MKVAVLYANVKNIVNNQLKTISENLSHGVSSNGHDVDLFNIYLSNNIKLTFYDYIVVITKAVSFFSASVPNVISDFLATSGMVSGKKSSCFIVPVSLRKQAVLLSLMKVLESEGMFVRTSDYIKNLNMAYIIGKHLRIE